MMPWPKGKKRSKKTIEQIKAYRKTQKPPNLKHGKYTKEALEEARKTKILRLFFNPRKQEVEDQTFVSTFGTYNNNITQVPLREFIKFQRKTKIWSSIAPERLDLDITEEELVRRVKMMEQGWDQMEHPDGSQTQLGRDITYAQIKNLATIYEDLGKKLLGRKVTVFNHYFAKSGRKPYHQQKNWIFFVRLHAILSSLRITKDEDIRLYIAGLWEGLKFPISTSIGFIPLKQLSSPRCVWYFMRFLQVQYESHVGTNLKSAERAMKTRYKGSYDNTLAADALSWCQYLIYNATEKSRVANEIPHAFSSSDFTVLYCYSSKYIRNLWRKGGLKGTTWTEFDAAMSAFHQRIQKEPRLKELARKVSKKASAMWKQGKFPVRADGDTDTIQCYFEDYPQTQEVLKQIL